MTYARATTLDPNPSGDTTKVAIVDKLDVDLSNAFTHLNTHEAKASDTHGRTGALVDTSSSQTMTQKTISACTLTGATTCSGATLTGGNTVNQTILTPTFTGSVTCSGATLTGGNTVNQTITTPTIVTPTLTGGNTINQTITTPVITGGTIQNTVATSMTLYTPTITGGTMTNTTLTSPTLTGATINASTLSSPTLTGTPVLYSAIQFPATQVASAGANDLDDYEENTWTPALYFGTGTTGVTYNTQTGIYTKIGRVVFLSGYIDLSSKGSSVGVATIQGLPFTANASAYGGASVLYVINITNSGAMTGFISPSTAVITLVETPTTGSTTGLTDADFANSSEMIFSAMYQV